MFYDFFLIETILYFYISVWSGEKSWSVPKKCCGSKVQGQESQTTFKDNSVSSVSMNTTQTPPDISRELMISPDDYIYENVCIIRFTKVIEFWIFFSAC